MANSSFVPIRLPRWSQVSLLLIGALALTTSCASISVKRASANGTLQPDDGIVYYPPKLYLSVSEKTASDKQVSLTMEVVELPDYSQPRVITWSSGWFGSVQPKISLTDGWMLGSIEGQVNSGTSEVISALAGVLTGLADTPPAQVKRGIFPIEWKDGDGTTPGSFYVKWDKNVLGN